MSTTDQASIVSALLHCVATEKVLPHQRNAFENLEASLQEDQKAAFTKDWRKVKPVLQLDVPYFSQRDSATAQGDRMCYSSTCAMAAEFLKPGCLAGSGQPDDRYLALVERFGDTTSSEAQLTALQSLGIYASFRQDGTFQDLLQQLERRRPIPVGWLHKGHVSAPSGGGHWSLVVGWDPETRQVIVHDPYGEANLVGGGYVTTAIGSGKGQRYSEQNWGRRWMVEPAGDGSYRYAPGKGWWLQLD